MKKVSQHDDVAELERQIKEINELVKTLQFDKDELENKRNEILNERKRNEQDFEVINNAMNTVRKVNNNQGYVEKTRVEFWANKFNISFDVLKRQIEKENIEIKDIKQRDDTDTNEAQPY
jgi:FtsZ-binding cell division protein ZapB